MPFMRGAACAPMRTGKLEEKLVKLLEAGMAAPSACNMQVWEFVVVTDKNTISELERLRRYTTRPLLWLFAQHQKSALEKRGLEAGMQRRSGKHDVGAVALGLGSVWIGLFNEEDVRRYLNIPKEINIMSLVCFGYPAVTKTPKTKYDESAVFWEKYEPERQRAFGQCRC